MDTNKAVLEQERKVVGDFVRSIIQEEAPQEVDILDTMLEEFYDATAEVPSDRIPDEQMFSFSATDFQAYMAGALLFVARFLAMPLLKRACEKAVDATAEKSVEALAKKIQSVPRRLKKEDQAVPQSSQIDLLVPVDWTAFERQIEAESKRIGLSGRRVKDLARLTVRELSDNQVLLGDMLLTVLRIPLSYPGSEG